MAKDYYLRFGSGDPAINTGLSPTFTIWASEGITLATPPGITETPTGSGLYRFQYTPTLSILFKVDGGGALASTDRFIVGGLDPVQAVDIQIGTLSDSIGSTSVDPSTLLGYAKRMQEVQEGNATFNKSTGVWDVSARGVSGALLFEKVLTNTTAQATKS